MTTNTVWHWTKNDPPKPEDFPLIAWGMECERVIWTAHDLKFLHSLADDGRATHWRSIKADPPPREQTQRERDEEAFNTFWTRHPNYTAMLGKDLWHAVLAWEREAVVKDLIEAYGAFTSVPCHLDTRTSAGFFRDFFRARREGGETK